MTVVFPDTTPDRGSKSQKPRLLIADDDNVIQSTLYMQFGTEFDVVGGARDADQAIELAERHQPDVALIDVQMPGGGGLRATREIRERVPHTAIVALSADESDSGVLAMLEAGAMAYLRKGMTSRDLMAVLHSSMAAHAQDLANARAGDVDRSGDEAAAMKE